MPHDEEVEIESMPEEVVKAIDGLLRDTFDTDFETKLVTGLREDGLLVAEHVLPLSDDNDEEMLAYIAYSEVHAKGSEDLMIFGLGPMAVKSDAQGNGIGLDFLNFSIETLQDEGVDAIVLLGHKDFYSKAGFKPAAEFGLTFSDDPAVNEYFMVLELQKGALQGCKGQVKYAEAFYQ